MSGKEFRDPSKILEERQEREGKPSCSGCAYWSSLWGVVICTKHEGRVGREVHTCSDFEQKKGAR